MIFSHVLYQLSYLGAQARREAGLVKARGYRGSLSGCPAKAKALAAQPVRLSSAVIPEAAERLSGTHKTQVVVMWHDGSRVSAHSASQTRVNGLEGLARDDSRVSSPYPAAATALRSPLVPRRPWWAARAADRREQCARARTAFRLPPQRAGELFQPVLVLHIERARDPA